MSAPCGPPPLGSVALGACCSPSGLNARITLLDASCFIRGFSGFSDPGTFFKQRSQVTDQADPPARLTVSQRVRTGLLYSAFSRPGADFLDDTSTLEGDGIFISQCLFDARTTDTNTLIVDRFIRTNDQFCANVSTSVEFPTAIDGSPLVGICNDMSFSGAPPVGDEMFNRSRSTRDFSGNIRQVVSSVRIDAGGESLEYSALVTRSRLELFVNGCIRTFDHDGEIDLSPIAPGVYEYFVDPVSPLHDGRISWFRNRELLVPCPP